MRPARVGLSLLLTAAATAADASVITDSLLRDRLIGAWADLGDCTKFALTFNPDGTFTLTGDNPATSGTFDVKDGQLAGRAGDRDMPVLPIFFDSDGNLVLGPDMLARCK